MYGMFETVGVKRREIINYYFTHFLYKYILQTYQFSVIII